MGNKKAKTRSNRGTIRSRRQQSKHMLECKRLKKEAAKKECVVSVLKNTVFDTSKVTQHVAATGITPMVIAPIIKQAAPPIASRAPVAAAAPIPAPEVPVVKFVAPVFPDYQIVTRDCKIKNLKRDRETTKKEMKDLNKKIAHLNKELEQKDVVIEKLKERVQKLQVTNAYYKRKYGRKAKAANDSPAKKRAGPVRSSTNHLDEVINEVAKCPSDVYEYL